MVKSNIIRRKFLEYFNTHGHEILPSASLIPQHDPTLFFVNAGMVQFKDVFTGLETRAIPRATTVQKCLRVSGKHNDLENVGRTPRHHTLFEMLGNFSFGDYFKEEAIRHAWSLLTDTLGVDGDRLWITVYNDDDDAYALWRDGIGVPESRIQRLGAKDNFWSMGDTGPCGPCAEIHYDHGREYDDNDGGPATESPRYVEIWNLVFMQFDQAANGSRTDLPRPSIDTGMGLERIAAVLQGVYSNYDTDCFEGLLHCASDITGVRYGAQDDADTAMRVLSDHARATAFLIADGVMPSNEGRGYVLRRVMRRAIRFGVKLGVDDLFLHRMGDVVVREFKDAYPELGERGDFIREIIVAEEERFRHTLGRGTLLLESALAKAKQASKTEPVLSGDVAFTLSDTYGFPLDLTELMADEQGVSVDSVGYKKSLDAQRERGRAAWKGSGEEAVAGLWHTLAEQHGPTQFIGYDRLAEAGTVVALVRKTDETLEQVSALQKGETGIALFDRTPFYGESGGQIGDSGATDSSVITDTTKAAGLHLHHVQCNEGPLSVGDTTMLSVGGARRISTQRNHTATHLLHAALRSILGEHVNQKGSLVDGERLRFDFSHHKAMTEPEVQKIEDQVNTWILENTALTTSVESLDDAVARGAMALFGEKYDSEVRVVQIGEASVELCGGTHVSRTGDIGMFRVSSESGIAAGVRRIEALTGAGAMSAVRETSARLSEAANELKTDDKRLVQAIQKLQSERRGMEKELRDLRSQLAKSKAGDLLGQAKTLHGVKVLATTYDGDLREQADRLRDQLGTSLIVLAAARGPKVQLIVAASKDIAGKTIHAGKLVQALAPMVGGRGGGRPDMAQAGGSEPDKISEMLEAAYAIAEETLKG
jgi:alanyl-tRNA synthetase